VLRSTLDSLVGLPLRIKAVADDIRALRVSAQRQTERVVRIEERLLEFNVRLATIEGLVSGLARDGDEAPDRLPDQDGGPLGKARDALSSDTG
jgi:hypothetical protein